MPRYIERHFVNWVETVSASCCWRGLRYFRFGPFVQLNHSAGPLAIDPKFGVDSGVAALRREVLSEQEITVKVKANRPLKKHLKVFVRQWLEPGHHSRPVFQVFVFYRRQLWRL